MIGIGIGIKLVSGLRWVTAVSLPSGTAIVTDGGDYIVTDGGDWIVTD